MNPISIERLCVFGLPPVEFVELAAAVDCRHIAIALTPSAYNPHDYPRWSLRGDATLRRNMLAAMRANDVSISLCEGFGVQRDADVSSYAADFELLSELNVKRINVASMDRDFNRTVDQFATITEMGEAFGIETTIEIGPGPIKNLSAALQAMQQVNKANFRLLLDTMHFCRSGGTAADIAALQSDVIGYVQLCDVPIVSKHATYMDEALHERMVPGTGELPLFDILAALPDSLIIGIEVPQRSLAEAGVGPRERVSRCVTATRALLQRVADHKAVTR